MKKTKGTVRGEGKVVRASQVKFRFEHSMGSSVLGIKRSIRVIASSGKSASGTHPATK